jgi:predicted GNAT family N-acyltransferase
MTPSAVLALYRSERWWPERTEPQMASVLETAPAVGAWEHDRLVGFARAVTDGVTRAYLEDVIVLPEMRRHGVGRELVVCLLGELAPVPLVTIFCQEGLAPFYESHGFEATRQVVLHRSMTQWNAGHARPDAPEFG